MVRVEATVHAAGSTSKLSQIKSLAIELDSIDVVREF
jgi:hypothetical protein